MDFIQLNHEQLFSQRRDETFELDLGATWLNMPQHPQQKFQISKFIQVLYTHCNVNVKLFGFIKSNIHNIVYGFEPEYLKCFFAHLQNNYNGGYNNTLRIND